MSKGPAPSLVYWPGMTLSSPGSSEVRTQMQVQVWAFWGEGGPQQHRDGAVPHGHTGDGHTERHDVRQRAVGVDALGGPEAGAL